MRWRIAILLLSSAALAVVVFGRDVSMPMPRALVPESDGHVTGGRPFHYEDVSSGVSVFCIANGGKSALYPPIFHVVPATFAPVVPLAASNASPPTAVWGGP